MSIDRTNWAGNLTFGAEEILHPTSVQQVQELVASRSRVRPLGTRHSFTSIADTTGTLVSLTDLAPDIQIDRAAMTASVTAGTRYGVLMQALQDDGLALHNTGSLPHISVGGATATGTHGSGDRLGILSTTIAAVEMVTADGSIVTIDRSDDHLSAVAVGLGAFGVITRITMDVEPTYRVRQDIYRHAPWETILDNLDEVMASAYSASLLADFSEPTVRQLWLKTRLPDDGDPDVAPTLFGGAWYDDSEELQPNSANPRASIPGPWSERMPHFRLDREPSYAGDELQTEYYVDRGHGVSALQALRGLGKEISPHLHVSEIRTTAADDLWLSPAFGRDSLCIGFTWANHPAEVAALLPVIEEDLAPFAARPHWGKLFHAGHEALRPLFPRMDDFKAVRRHHDPNGKFWNAFLERVLGAP